MDIIGRSLSAAAVIALIVFMRQVMFKRLPKRVLSALWLIAAVKLLLPFGGITVTVAETSDTAVAEVAYSAVQTVQTVQSVPIFPNMVINVAMSVPASEDVFFVMHCIWLFGAFFIGAFFVICHIKCRKTFSCAIPAGYNITPLKNDFGLIRRIRLLVSDRTDTPLTYGVFAPVVILPKSMELHGDSVRNVLCHELAHIKRMDALFKTVIAVCAAVHWFNPLVWIMFVLANRDIELACDETALRCGKAAPEDYAMTLIRVEEKRSYPFGKNLHLMGSFAGGKLEERIRGVMTKRKSVPAGLLAAVVSAAAAAALNVIVMPYVETSYDLSMSVPALSAVDVYEYSEMTTAYDDSVTEDIPVVYYSDVIVEQAAYADYPYEEVTEADYMISVTEDVPE
ncbi:MAG: M56 family metallopeptidase, partial [Oscillospiraceae bacterium]|nr:M56 family metallopeptidase [Oscillospiraceae bacterium]